MSLKKKIVSINEKLKNHFGVPERAKKLPQPLDLLIATILSQNTNDKNSYKAYRNLQSKFYPWEKILNASVEEIEREIKVAGLSKQKANSIKHVVDYLAMKEKKPSLNFVQKLNNEQALKVMTDFPGVGIKTASCVLLFSLDRNICPVDTHVHRTLNRIGLVKTSSPEKTFFEINKDFPEGIAHSFHTNLIRLGREICTAKSPNCPVCPLKKICVYPDKNVKNTKKKDGSFMLLDNV